MGAKMQMGAKRKRNLTFCPESEVLWNVWLGDSETCVGRVQTIRGQRRFVAGEKGFPCGEGNTFDAEQNYPFTSSELREIVDFLESDAPWWRAGDDEGDPPLVEEIA